MAAHADHAVGQWPGDRDAVRPAELEDASEDLVDRPDVLVRQSAPR